MDVEQQVPPPDPLLNLTPSSPPMEKKTYNSFVDDDDKMQKISKLIELMNVRTILITNKALNVVQDFCKLISNLLSMCDSHIEDAGHAWPIK